MTFASLAQTTKKKVTRRKKFLAEMDAVVPWSRLLALIELHPDDEYINRLIAKVRARVEHPFRVLKRQFG
jgi:hypothetical protein